MFKIDNAKLERVGSQLIIHVDDVSICNSVLLGGAGTLFETTKGHPWITDAPLIIMTGGK